MPLATVRLFYETCPFPHVRALTPTNAAELLRMGETVLVMDVGTAIDTLVALGLSRDEAGLQIAYRAPVDKD